MSMPRGCIHTLNYDLKVDPNGNYFGYIANLPAVSAYGDTSKIVSAKLKDLSIAYLHNSPMAHDILKTSRTSVKGLKSFKVRC